MPKPKTHKGLTKRIKITATGKVRHKRCGAGHLMSGKNAKRKRYISKPAIMAGAMAKKVKEKLTN